MSIKKHLNFLKLLYKKKENIPCDFLIDEIDVDSLDSYFFHNFLDVYVVHKMKLKSDWKLLQSKQGKSILIG